MEKEARVCTGCYNDINKGKEVFFVIAVLIEISLLPLFFLGSFIALIGVDFPISEMEG